MSPVTMQLVADKYIRLALEEDINSENVFTNSVMPEYKKGEVQLIYGENGIITGLQIFGHVFTLLDPETRVIFDVRDGEEVKRGQHLTTVTKGMRVLPSGEWTTLSYLQRLSGIATYTHTVAGVSEGTGIGLPDTRKTTLCMCISEEYAVWIGDGQNHHYDLSDGVLLKDNRIDAAGGVREAMTVVKVCTSLMHRIGVGTGNPNVMKEAVDAGADIIMLGNMTPERMAEAIRYIGGRVEIGCLGNMIKENIRTITELGVDCVSSDTLTHSSLILDISLRHLRVLTDWIVTTSYKREQEIEYAMNETQRRRKLLDMMRQASTPLSGGALGREIGVSRQVVVQDIALLRTIGHSILPIVRGHVLNESKHASRLLKARHTDKQTGDELVAVADLGGTVADVVVNHRVYGKVSAPLSIKNRRDVQLLMNNIQTERSTSLMNAISGYHFHHVCAEQEEILDEIEEALRKKRYLTDLLPYGVFDNE